MNNGGAKVTTRASKGMLNIGKKKKEKEKEKETLLNTWNVMSLRIRINVCDSHGDRDREVWLLGWYVL